MLNTKVANAIAYAVIAHGEQKRKYTHEPYVVHPIAVAEMLNALNIGATENMLCAAILHDVIEDCGVTAQQVEEKFGAEVAKLVVELTKVTDAKDGPRKVRKEIERQRLSKVSPEAQTIKVADMLHNMESIVEYDPKFAKVFLTEMRELVESMKEANPVIVEIANKKLNELGY
jgi:(p)ppGpp synthase/HD superfamily hydrolase